MPRFGKRCVHHRGRHLRRDDGAEAGLSCGLASASTSWKRDGGCSIVENRMEYRKRCIAYGENAWPGDFIEDQAAARALFRARWRLAVRRCIGEARATGFSEEDLRLKSMYGLYTSIGPWNGRNWKRYLLRGGTPAGGIGRAQSACPKMRDRNLIPMPAMELTYNLLELKKWGEKERHSVLEHPAGKEHGCPMAAARNAFVATRVRSAPPEHDTRRISLLNSCWRTSRLRFTIRFRSAAWRWMRWHK